MSTLIRLQQISLSFGGPPILDKVDFTLTTHERVALVGRNGVGKSTLLHLLAGTVPFDSGDLVYRQHLFVSTLPQAVPDLGDMPVAQVLAINTQSVQDYELASWAALLDIALDTPFNGLSGGQKRRVLLAQALLPKPDVLLLDEPTNHLDLPTIAWLEERLLAFSGSIVFVTHDRSFLNRLATRLIELDRGILRNYPGNYATYQERKQAELASEATSNALFDKRLAEEEQWVRQGIKARRTRNEGRVRALEQMRRERAARREVKSLASMKLNPAQESGKLVIEAKNLGFDYEGQHLIQGFSTRIERGDKIGIIGPNGCGKSTLIKLLLGEIEPSQGMVRMGTQLVVAYADQLRQQLNVDQTVAQQVSYGDQYVNIHGRQVHIHRYLQDFLFTPDQIRAPVSTLSGGERNRLLLARLFTQPANLLVLDEPTNDLDVETLELLENLLVEYEGTLLLVSHDRTFLDNVVTSTFVFEEDGINEYVGGYEDWLRQRKASKTPIATTTAASVPVPKTTKLSGAEIRERQVLIRKLEAKITKLEAEQHQLQHQLADPDLYTGNHAKLATLQQALAKTEAELAEVTAQWEQLID